MPKSTEPTVLLELGPDGQNPTCLLRDVLQEPPSPTIRKLVSFALPMHMSDFVQVAEVSDPNQRKERGGLF